MNGRSGLAIVIPAHNEEASIASVVRESRRYGQVVVVSDGSQDATDARAAEAGAEVLRLDPNRGYDGALAAGLQHAQRRGFALAVTCDADGQHDPAAIPALVAPLRRGAWVTIGIRERRPRLAESAFCLVTSWCWGIRDPMCGMKAYRCALLAAIPRLGSWRSVGFEAALFAARRRLTIAQVPIPIRPRQHGSTRFGATWRAEVRILSAMRHALMRRGDR